MTEAFQKEVDRILREAKRAERAGVRRHLNGIEARKQKNRRNALRRIALKNRLAS
jgi:hypothetical protein